MSKDIERMIADAKTEAYNEVAEIALVAAGVGAWDTFDATPESMHEFAQKFKMQFDCLVAGTAKIEDLREILDKEAHLIMVVSPAEHLAKEMICDV